LRTSAEPRILRLIPTSASEINFSDLNSMRYLFKFADIIKVNITCPANCSCNSSPYCNVVREHRLIWTGFFLERLPINF
jgi:hypothetical protein